MKITNINKQGSSPIGFAIIALGILLLIGSFFSNNIQQDNNLNHKYNNYSNSNEQYLLYINNSAIGKNQKIIENYNNIILGSKKEYNIVYIGNNFILNANPFTSNKYSFKIKLDNPKFVNYLLLYFKNLRSSGNQNLKIYFNNQLISNNKASNIDIPIKIKPIKLNKTNTISFELEKPKVYQIFNWNKALIKDLKIIEEKQNKNNNIRKFNFSINKLNLKQAYIKTTIKCFANKDISEPIQIILNGQIISDENPNCISNYNTITSKIPINILNNKNNNLIFKTDGLYKIAYSINKIYFNEQDIYSFNINSFNDILDVTISGNFNKEVMDLKINGKYISINRGEIKSIINLVRFGTNTIEILTKPIEIKELKIEKSQYYE